MTLQSKVTKAIAEYDVMALRKTVGEIMKTFKNQKEMFDYIWENREHKSELSGLPLLPKGHNQWHWQFLHVLPKGSYPKYKLRPENIILALPSEHIDQEEYEIFKAKKDELIPKYYKEVYGKKF